MQSVNGAQFLNITFASALIATDIVPLTNIYAWL